ncbi:MAG: indolepyruvate ferredoxin oxidoreductase subunit alpha, partial [Pseudomonadota bacterium]
ASFGHEQEKVKVRWPAAIRFIKERKLNEHFGPQDAKVGIICQGGMFNNVIRALERLDLADRYGGSEVPIYCLNVTYPLVDDEITDFCAGKDAVFVVEEGQPAHIEEAIGSILYKAGGTATLTGKGFLPLAGELTGAVMLSGMTDFLRAHAPHLLPDAERSPNNPDERIELPDLSGKVPVRPPGFCTGCPERPIFAAMKLVEKELGEHHVAADIGCHLFSILPPFNIGATTMGYGLGPASASAFNVRADKRPIAIMGDGGFWHNGLTSGIGNAVFNEQDGVILIVDNYYSAATGGQDILSSRADNKTKSTKHPITAAVRGMGVEWVRQIDRTYDVAQMRDTLRDALTTPHEGPKVIVASSECMLNKQRRERPKVAKAIASGKRMVKPRFGVDEDVCTGDHACIRLSGCPSLSVKQLDDPLRDDPVAAIDNTCVGCGNCGEVAEAAVLCPSFYQADVVYNPGGFESWLAGVRESVIGFLQRRRARRRLVFHDAPAMMPAE